MAQDVDTLAVETFDKNAHDLMGFEGSSGQDVSALDTSEGNMFTDNSLLFFVLGVIVAVAVGYFVRNSKKKLKEELIKSMKEELVPFQDNPAPPSKDAVKEPNRAKFVQGELPLQTSPIPPLKTERKRSKPSPVSPEVKNNYYTPSTGLHRKEMRELISQWAAETGITTKELKVRVRKKMGIPRIDYLSIGQVEEACKWIRSCIKQAKLNK